MLKLANNTKILFIQDSDGPTKYSYMGWNNVYSLAHVLNARLKKGHSSWSATMRHREVHRLLEVLSEKGFLTPEEAMDDLHGFQSHWVVEKAIPFDIRGAVKRDEVPLTDILKQLKV